MYKGIDLDHIRFLILQGEVEQMALMKPKGLTENDGGMLELLEDIIGTSSSVYKSLVFLRAFSYIRVFEEKYLYFTRIFVIYSYFL